MMILGLRQWPFSQTKNGKTMACAAGAFPDKIRSMPVVTDSGGGLQQQPQQSQQSQQPRPPQRPQQPIPIVVRPLGPTHDAHTMPVVTASGGGSQQQPPQPQQPQQQPQRQQQELSRDSLVVKMAHWWRH